MSKISHVADNLALFHSGGGNVCHPPHLPGARQLSSFCFAESGKIIAPHSQMKAGKTGGAQNPASEYMRKAEHQIKGTLRLAQRVAVALIHKADAIAQGHYDKDIDWDLRDRTLWAARLYTIADKVEASQKLTRAEHEELCNAGNYLPGDTDAVFFIRDLEVQS